MEFQIQTLCTIQRKFSKRLLIKIEIALRVAECYEYAMKPEHQWSPDPTVKENSITETGALCISSGSKTGRVPKEKRIVLDEITKDVS